MKQKAFWVVIVGAAFLAAALPLSPAEHYKVLNYPGNFYFGHVSYIEPGDGGEGPVILREGREVPEPAVLNFPVGPGDVVRTSPDRRLEIQFDTGTLVRLDFATEVKVETILARSLSSLDELSNLNLVAGRVYVMYKEYNRRETFQILTANAAVKMRHNSVSLISSAADESTEVQVALGRARVLFGEDTARLREQDVRKQERFIVRGNHQSQLASSIDGTDFELWNRDVNARFAELHEGLTPIPKPVQRMSPAVFYFAQNYGNLYGEWLWDDFLGYVWRPFIDNARYPWGWQPYYYGRWAYSSGGMFWVPQEPWGWIPYHLG
ncbi:MAG: FecR domain-containing protein, partial [Candidatus Aminicenantes bacterium]